MEGHGKLQFGDAVGVCRDQDLCCELFIYMAVPNLGQDVLGNHSELDKQKIVTLALYFTVSVVAIVRKAQGVERRWVR